MQLFKIYFLGACVYPVYGMESLGKLGDSHDCI